jgi:hypothetical protein
MSGRLYLACWIDDMQLSPYLSDRTLSLRRHASQPRRQLRHGNPSDQLHRKPNKEPVSRPSPYPPTSGIRSPVPSTSPSAKWLTCLQSISKLIRTLLLLQLLPSPISYQNLARATAPRPPTIGPTDMPLLSPTVYPSTSPSFSPSFIPTII